MYRSQSILNRRTLARLVLLSVFGAGAALTQNTSIFGPNVYVFDPSISNSAIQTTLQALSGTGQFGTQRYAVLFMPGTYNLQAKVGFYESIAGLGETPNLVAINGFLTPNFSGSNGGAITTTFWRSMENLTINVATNTSQNAPANTLQWGVSQGASLRRLNINGNVELADTGCGYASGGFIGDTVITGTVYSCSQQQWFTRNSVIGSWTQVTAALIGDVPWNMVFSGVVNAPAQSWPIEGTAGTCGGLCGPPPYTTLDTPAVRERPFLYVDSSLNYNVFVPTLRTDSTGTSWSNGSLGIGYSLPISAFFIATPSNTLSDINSALASGQNLILTPGIYKYSGSINITNPNTIVLGLGYADVVPQSGTPAITVADVNGVQIAGLLIDAGPVNSSVLLQVGNPGGPMASHAANPTSISDVHVRIGGATAGTATTSFEMDSDNVILDNTWLWRADHGTDASWTGNIAAHGLVVNADNVTALGLSVEHYQQNQVVWNGDGGETIFYQSEFPYDPPTQSAWLDGSINGYASYFVSPNVTTHRAYGLGVYSNFNNPVVADMAISVPPSAGVTITDAVSVWLSNKGSITHVVNDAGATVSGAGTPPPVGDRSYLAFYRGASCTTDCQIVSGTVELLASTTLVAQGGGGYQAMVTITNSGNGTALNTVLTGVSIGGVSGTPGGTAFGNIAPGNSVVATIAIPASAGTPGSRVVEKVSGTYTAGTFGGSYRITLP